MIFDKFHYISVYVTCFSPSTRNTRPGTERTVVKKVELSDNSIQNEGAIAIGESLKSNKSLEELVLIRCSIGIAGFRGLAEGLRISAALTKLDARFNSAGNAVAGSGYGGRQAVQDAVKGRDGFELLL